MIVVMHIWPFIIGFIAAIALFGACLSYALLREGSIMRDCQSSDE